MICPDCGVAFKRMPRSRSVRCVTCRPIAKRARDRARGPAYFQAIKADPVAYKKRKDRINAARGCKTRAVAAVAGCLLLIGLAGCTAQTPLDLAVCATALATTTETDAAKEALLAASNPACLAATAEAINAIIAAQASGKAQSW